jgi:hypothetical protein
MSKQQVRRDALEERLWEKVFKSYPELGLANCMLSFLRGRYDRWILLLLQSLQLNITL